MTRRNIFITEYDSEVMNEYFSRYDSFEYFGMDRDSIRVLEEALEHANVLPQEEIPRDVISLNSRVKFRDLRTGQEEVYVIVFPCDADLSASKISVFSPIGIALLGRRIGESVKIRIPRGTRTVRILRVHHLTEPARPLAA